MTAIKGIKSFLSHWGVWILLIFHLVGLVGLLSPWQDLFIRLTPFHLLLVALVLVSGHLGSEMKLLVFFFTASILSFFSEVLGVKTGLIFGEYAYGPGLGVHLFEVPLTIGLNWFVLTYSATVLCWKFIDNKLLVALISGLVLVLFDLLMEPVAPGLLYWEFFNGVAPLQNYIGWFIVAFAIVYAAGDMLKDASNHLAFPVLFIQALFFIILNIGR
jgi:putative membrane protein